MTEKKPTIILATGGTAGHVFPAISLAETLDPKKFDIVFFTDKRGSSLACLPKHCRVVKIQARRISGRNPFKISYRLIVILYATVTAWWVLRKLQPFLVIGFGSYASLPSMIAAIFTKTTTMLHEQNAILGRTNKLLAPMIDHLALSFDKTNQTHAFANIVKSHTGNPVRQSITKMASRIWKPLDHKGVIKIVVFGGSQGAEIMGIIVPAALANLPDSLRKRIQIVQQVRKEQKTTVSIFYKKLQLKKTTLKPFIDDIPKQLAECHLVIARSGALSLAEITAIGCPSILIPYPHATDDHQTVNAIRISDAGAGWLIPQTDFNADSLSQKLITLFQDPKLLDIAAHCAKKLGRPYASNNLLKLVIKIASHQPLDSKKE